jgi:acylphosphatase
MRAADAPKKLLMSIQQRARDLKLEGTAQMLVATSEVRIIVCGESDDVESFLDALHGGFGKWFSEKIDTEPFLSDRDYRGIFRIIE